MSNANLDLLQDVPGTVRLLDGVGHRQDAVHDTAAADIILVPQPTQDPNDPLRWGRLRKEVHFWQLWFWGFIAAVSVNWSGPVWTELTVDLATDYVQLNIAAALCWLFLGLGCVFLQPTAMKIGRRPVYIIATLINIAGCIWGGVMVTVQHYYGVNILTGFGAAPVDSLVEISTTDIFFLHERGTRLSLCIFAIYAGSYLGPVAAGYIVDSQSWRWCSWYLVIFFVVLLIGQIFFLEESSFRRPLELPSQVEMTLQYSDHEKSNSATQKYEEKKNATQTTSEDRHLHVYETTPSPKTFVQRMSLWDRSQCDQRPWLVLAAQPFFLVVFPPIVWAGVVYGVQVMWLSLLASTQSLIFAAPPYNFSIEAVGDTNFAAFIGGCFGTLWGGLMSDWYLKRLARKNKGIMEPEFRLWMMAFPGLINTAGLLLYGIGAARGLHWIVPAGFGTGFIAFGIGSGGAIAISYAIDCYPSIAAQSLVLMLFLRNMIGTGFTFAIQPWLNLNGLQTTSIIMAVLCLVFNMSFLIFAWKGKSIRKWTSKQYFTLIESSRKLPTEIA